MASLSVRLKRDKTPLDAQVEKCISQLGTSELIWNQKKSDVFFKLFFGCNDATIWTHSKSRNRSADDLLLNTDRSWSTLRLMARNPNVRVAFERLQLEMVPITPLTVAGFCGTLVINSQRLGLGKAGLCGFLGSRALVEEPWLGWWWLNMAIQPVGQSRFANDWGDENTFGNTYEMKQRICIFWHLLTLYVEKEDGELMQLFSWTIPAIAGVYVRFLCTCWSGWSCSWDREEGPELMLFNKNSTVPRDILCDLRLYRGPRRATRMPTSFWKVSWVGGEEWCGQQCTKYLAFSLFFSCKRRVVSKGINKHVSQGNKVSI